MAATELTESRTAVTEAAQGPAPVCQTYHIDFLHCVIRKSYLRPEHLVEGLQAERP